MFWWPTGVLLTKKSSARSSDVFRASSVRLPCVFRASVVRCCFLRAASVFSVPPWFAVAVLGCGGDLKLGHGLALLAPRRPDQLTVHHRRRGDAEPVEHGGEEIEG